MQANWTNLKDVTYPQKICKLANIQGPDEMPQNVPFNLGLHFLLRRNQSSETSANSAKPDQMPQNAASDQVLLCLQIDVSIKNE